MVNINSRNSEIVPISAKNFMKLIYIKDIIAAYSGLGFRPNQMS